MRCSAITPQAWPPPPPSDHPSPTSSAGWRAQAPAEWGHRVEGRGAQAPAERGYWVEGGGWGALRPPAAPMSLCRCNLSGEASDTLMFLGKGVWPRGLGTSGLMGPHLGYCWSEGRSFRMLEVGRGVLGSEWG